MATPKVQTTPRAKRLRVPSDQEMERMGMLWSYARVRRIGRDHGLDALALPREFRMAKAAAGTAPIGREHPEGDRAEDQ